MSTNLHNDLVGRWKAGESMRALADAYGVSHETICARLDRAGARPRSRHPLPLDVDAIVRRYAAGETAEQIGQEFGCDMGTVLARLRAAGVPIRPFGPQPLVLDIHAIAARYLEKGESSRTIGRALGVDNVTILNRLRDAGVQIRPRGGQRKRG